MASTPMKMKPMFLPEVEQNPQPGPYADMIRRAQESGGEYWKIWNLFAFRPEATAHLARFTHAVIAAELIGSEELVWNALRDLESAALPENEKALLRFAGTVTHDLSAIR